MRKIYLDCLPKNKNKISWKDSIGCDVYFEYDDIKGFINIVDYSKRKITIKFNNKKYEIGIGEFKDCNLGLFLKHINLSDELYDRWYKLKNSKIKTTFEISKNNKYWIGHTWENDEFWFNGDENTINYIKQHTWRKISDGYFQNEKEEKLHRIVMHVSDKNVFINHLGGRKWDNRIENLTISDSYDNSKEKVAGNRNNTGIVGLVKRGKNDKYIGSVKINGIEVHTKYKIKQEAIIDLLIVQKHYGYRHNENMYYLLDNVSQERITEVLKNIDRQLESKKEYNIKSNNRYVLSEDKKYYKVYDANNNSFLISKESKNKVEKGVWHVAHDISNNSISIHGSIIINGIRKTVKLHRYLFDLLDDKYKNWNVVKINNDELDNRLENLVITNSEGNGLSKNINKGYQKRNGKYRVNITILGKRYRKTCETEQEAINYIKLLRDNGMLKRLQFRSKKELDDYINGGNNED